MAYAKNARRGAKPKYSAPEEIEGLIDAYFTECEGTLLTDHNGDPILDKWGNPVYLSRRPPTVTGLALALGFKTRTALLRYQAKKEFEDLITEAKSRVEKYVEEQLFSRDGAKGAIFSLQHNFAGWQDAKDGEGSEADTIVIKLARNNPPEKEENKEPKEEKQNG